MDGKFKDSVASPSDSLEGAHAHAIKTRPSFLPRVAGSEAIPLKKYISMEFLR